MKFATLSNLAAAVLVIVSWVSLSSDAFARWGCGGCSGYAGHVAWAGSGYGGGYGGYGYGGSGYSTWGYNPYGGWGSSYGCCGSSSYGGYGSSYGSGCGSHCGGGGCASGASGERTFQWGSVPTSAGAPLFDAVDRRSVKKSNRVAKRVEETRDWKNASGKVLVHGHAFVVVDGRVGISKSAGGTTTLLLADLGTSDRDYLAAHVAKPEAIASKSTTAPRVASRP